MDTESLIAIPISGCIDTTLYRLNALLVAFLRYSEFERMAREFRNLMSLFAVPDFRAQTGIQTRLYATIPLVASCDLVIELLMSPQIASTVNNLAWSGAVITIENPVALYLDS